MLSPLVSVIIPLYNSEKHITETLQSIYAQTYDNIEVIIVDDGSTDNSYNIANNVRQPNTIVLKQANKGASAARNLGIKHANGQFIQFIDADDLISEDKIELQINLLKDKLNALAVCSTIHFADGNNPILEVASSYEEDFLFNDNNPMHFLINLMGGYSAGGSMIPIHSWLVPKSIIELAGNWNEKLSMDDDGEYFCRVVLNSHQIIKTGGFSFYRRSQKNSSLSSQTNLKSYESMLKSYKLRKQHLFSKTDINEAKVAVYKLFMNLAVGSYIEYPAISKLALAEVPKINVPNYIPSVGGTFSTYLAKIFGWKIVKRIQNVYRKLSF
ncbi:MAG: glycosyltransferase family 2 protein [Pedobacter sp.]|nr:MAG: glycosyltransferase family 2 protein [Pedobacter sp.]